MTTLLSTSGLHIGRRFTLGKMTRAGRAPDNEIVLADNLVSRYHAQFEKRGGAFIVEDLGSKNGIEVNDQRLTQHRLKRGDRVRIGNTLLVYEAPQELKTARFTNTLIHLDPEEDEAMKVIDRPSVPAGGPGDPTALIIKVAQIFEASSATDLPEVLQKVLHDMLDLQAADAGSILLRGREDEVVPLTASDGADELHINQEAVRTALTEGRAVLGSLIATKERGKASRRARRAMVIPMFEHDQVFGALYLERNEGGDFTLKDVAFMQTVSRLLSGAIRQAIRIDQLGQHDRGPSRMILGDSEPMNAIRAQMAKVAPTEATVLLTGETGTGKELIARSIHAQSNRSGGPFVAINCAAIPDNLIENELFGHERGAFTGADSMKRGKVEMADGGTLFLDEIGEMQVEMQPKLLRFLEERIFYRVGGVRPIQTDVRILAATNRDLESTAERGQFRQDLLYRLNVVNIEMPPLRERREDIRTIIQQLAPSIASRVGKPFVGISDSAWTALNSYVWPGNVRELLQSVERALILSDDGVLRREHFQIPEASIEHDTTGTRTAIDQLSETSARTRGEPPTLASVEKKAITRALRFSKGNKIRAAELLGIHRNTLRKKIEEYRIEI